MKAIHIMTVSLLCGAAVTASATISFGTGNQQYNNVNFAANTDSYTITGQATIGGQDLNVIFSEMIGPDRTTQVTMHASHGDATIQSYQDSLTSAHTGFSSLLITPQTGYGFTAGDFKLDELNKLPDGFVTFYGIDQFLNQTEASFAIDPNGQSPYLFTTSGGEMVTSIRITTGTNVLLQDFKQMSVDMAPVGVVPEPSTFVAGALLLLPLGGAFLRTLKRKELI